MGNLAHKCFNFQKNKHVANNAFEEKNKHIKSLNRQVSKFKRLNKYVKGLNNSKIKNIFPEIFLV